MLDILKTTLNSRTMPVCLFILITGISAGIFFGGMVPVSEKLHLIALMQNSEAHFFPTVFMHIAAVVLIILAGFTVYGFPLASFILFFRSFSVGFCDCLLLYNLAPGDIPGFIFSFMLPQLLICVIYLIAFAASIRYALSHLRSSGR